jgi:hypothetical protein
VTSIKADLVQSHHRQQKGEPSFFFTTEMLEVYGLVQLQALQEVLEQHLFPETSSAPAWHRKRLMAAIKNKITSKLNYPHRVPDSRAADFLWDFYCAMRKYLEGKLLSGRLTMAQLKDESRKKVKGTRWQSQLPLSE